MTIAEQDSSLNARIDFLQKLLRETRNENEKIISLLADYVKEMILSNIEKSSSPSKKEQEKALSIAIVSAEALLVDLRPDKRSLLTKLTNKEFLVAILIMDGLSTPKISQKTGFSLNMVKFYRDNLREKLGVPKRGPHLRNFLRSIHY